MDNRISTALSKGCDLCIVKTQYGAKPIVGTFKELGYLIEQYVDKVKTNDPVVGVYGANWYFDTVGKPVLRSVFRLNEEGKLEFQF